MKTATIILATSLSACFAYGELHFLSAPSEGQMVEIGSTGLYVWQATSSATTWTDTNVPHAIFLYAHEPDYTNAAGQIYDQSGHSCWATRNGTPDRTLAHTNEHGALHYVAGFDGSSESYTPSCAFPTGTAPRTVSFWAKLDASAGDVDTPFSYGSGSSGEVFFKIHWRSTNPHFDLWVSGSRYCSTPHNSAPKSVWHHWTWTYDGSTIRCYRNGVELALTHSGSSTYTLSTASGNERIGYDAHASIISRHWHGQLDRVAVYSNAVGPSFASNSWYWTPPVRGLSGTYSGGNVEDTSEY